MSDHNIRVDHKKLKNFARAVFSSVGMSCKDAETVAEVLVWANLRGIDSHGVLRLPLYLNYLETGAFNPSPNICVLKETSATMLIDADQALGPTVTKMAMSRAISKAKKTGVCWVVIRRTSHQGAMGYYALMAAERDMIGFVSVSGPPNMVPHGAKIPGVHNSPIAIGVPTNLRRPLVLDMATSVVAGGKIDLAVDKGQPIPLGWLLDEDGNPTTNPEARSRLVPMGGPKGSGLALLLECMSSVIAGNPILALALQGKDVLSGSQNSTIAAIDISAFTDVKMYKENVDRTIEGIKRLPSVETGGEVLVPGEIEDQIYKDRVKNGVPLPQGTLENLYDVAKQLNLPLFAL